MVIIIDCDGLPELVLLRFHGDSVVLIEGDFHQSSLLLSVHNLIYTHALSSVKYREQGGICEDRGGGDGGDLTEDAAM